MVIDARLGAVDWAAAHEALTREGFARLPRLLTAAECADLVSLYPREDLFRTRIDMARYRFGRGEYQYFAYPLPPMVEDLRRGLYPRLQPVANDWARMYGTSEFPNSLDALLAACHEHGQTKPTPLMLRYGPGDFNCLHQDLYGAIAFPMQVVFFLSQIDRDYDGGEFLLMEQQPRAQSIGRVIRPDQGDALVITTRHRPAQGKRGAYRVNVRHGVSQVASGERWTMGIIFHDAQ